MLLVALAAQVTYVDDGFGIRLDLPGPWTISEQAEEEGTSFLVLEKGEGVAGVAYTTMPNLGNDQAMALLFMNQMIAEFGGEGLRVEGQGPVAVAGLSGYEKILSGTAGGYEGVARVVSFAYSGRVVILAFGRENAVSFTAQDAKDMDEFMAGLRFAF